MITNAIPAALTNPVHADLVVSQINTRLAANLAWLTTAYGIAEKREKLEQDATVQFPAIYAPSGAIEEYVDLRPDAQLGNYCFWNITNAHEDRLAGGRLHLATYGIDLTFWYDFRDIYTATATEYQEHNNRNVMEQVVPLLNRGGFLNGNVEFTAAFERSEQIFAGYTIPEEIKTQYLMRPYGGFRISMTLRARPDC